MLAEASSQGLPLKANGFNPNDVITLYGGQLLTERQAREKEMEPGEHDYMLRISAKDGSALAFVDGHQFADGLSREPDADGSTSLCQIRTIPECSRRGSSRAPAAW